MLKRKRLKDYFLQEAKFDKHGNKEIKSKLLKYFNSGTLDGNDVRNIKSILQNAEYIGVSAYSKSAAHKSKKKGRLIHTTGFIYFKIKNSLGKTLYLSVANTNRNERILYCITPQKPYTLIY